MKKEPVFRGVATALATPFDEKGIDYVAFAKMIDFQLTHGADALVVCGTTGESATLTEEEKKAIIDFSVRQVRRRVPLIVGTGANDTKRACALSEYAAKAGADALLVITPYYNKCTQKGLTEYYNAVGVSAGIPFIAYNVPSRTGLKIEPETAFEIAKNPLCKGLKDAGDSMAETIKTASLCGEELPLYSGNDDRIVPILSVGGLGVISVASNLIPAQIKRMCTFFFDGNTEAAGKLQMNIIPLCKFLFSEVNPIPLKYALNKAGLCKNILRPPLSCLSVENESLLTEALTALGLK